MGLLYFSRLVGDMVTPFAVSQEEITLSTTPMRVSLRNYCEEGKGEPMLPVIIIINCLFNSTATWKQRWQTPCRQALFDLDTLRSRSHEDDVHGDVFASRWVRPLSDWRGFRCNLLSQGAEGDGIYFRRLDSSCHMRILCVCVCGLRVCLWLTHQEQFHVLEFIFQVL